jgi:hypothetical protein
MSRVTFSVEEEIIVNALDAFINQGGVRDLIKDMFNHNDKAKMMLGRLLLGETLPFRPKIGQIGMFKMSTQWFSNKDTTKDTDLDLKGYISCRVTSLGAYTDYSPIKVDVPTYNNSGAVEIISTGLDYDEFIWLEEDK